MAGLTPYLRRKTFITVTFTVGKTSQNTSPCSGCTTPYKYVH